MLVWVCGVCECVFCVRISQTFPELSGLCVFECVHLRLPEDGGVHLRLSIYQVKTSVTVLSSCLQLREREHKARTHLNRRVVITTCMA